MEKRHSRRARSFYDRRRMAVQHPIDREIRERLRQMAASAKPRQIELAKRIGRSPAWVNKYLNGAGHATVDDVIRIVATVIGLDPPGVTDAERRLLRAWRRLPLDRQEDALDFLQRMGRRRTTRSTARSGQSPRGANN